MLVLKARCRQAPGRRRRVAADKDCDTPDFVQLVRELGVTPHVSQNTRRTGGSAIDRRTTRHAGYAQGQARRARIERVLGRIKSVAELRKVKLCGFAKVDGLMVFASAAFNLQRPSRLLSAAPASRPGGGGRPLTAAPQGPVA